VVTKFRVVPAQSSAQDWLHTADDDILGCRGQGHRYPKLRAGRRKIKGIQVRPPVDGIYQIEATCPDCGTIRIENTLPGGALERPVRYRYIYPDNYRPAKGTLQEGERITRQASFGETWRRSREEILSSADTA
jgi:hypothetical protein